MKQLKYPYAISCICHKTGLEGDFIIDVDYFKKTHQIAALDGKVFKCLIELFRYANDNNISTNRIY